MKEVVLYGTNKKLWDLYESLVLENIVPRPKMVGDAQSVIIYVKEISIEEADAILSEDNV